MTDSGDDAVERLRSLIRIPTVSHRDPALVDTGAFDAFLDELHDEVHPRCESGGCSPTREREELGYTTRKAYKKAIAAGLGWQCPEILERLGDANDCLDLRKAIDEECFKVPGPDSTPEYREAFKGHQRQVESALYAVESCEELAEARGCRPSPVR